MKSDEISDLKVIEVMLLANETLDEKHREAQNKKRIAELKDATGKLLVKRKAVVESESTPGFSTPGGGLFGFMTPSGSVSVSERKEVKKADTALICVVNGHLLILRNKWYNWKFEANDLCDHGFGGFRKRLQEEIATQEGSIPENKDEVSQDQTKEGLQSSMAKWCKTFKT